MIQILKNKTNPAPWNYLDVLDVTELPTGETFATLFDGGHVWSEQWNMPKKERYRTYEPDEAAGLTEPDFEFRDPDANMVECRLVGFRRDIPSGSLLMLVRRLDGQGHAAPGAEKGLGRYRIVSEPDLRVGRDEGSLWFIPSSAIIGQWRT